MWVRLPLARSTRDPGDAGCLSLDAAGQRRAPEASPQRRHATGLGNGRRASLGDKPNVNVESTCGFSIPTVSDSSQQPPRAQPCPTIDGESRRQNVGSPADSEVSCATRTIGKRPELVFLAPPAGIEPAIPSRLPERSGAVGGYRSFAVTSPGRGRQQSARFDVVGANCEYKPSTGLSSKRSLSWCARRQPATPAATA